MSEIAAKDVVVDAKEVVAETVSVSVEASVEELEVTETVTTTTTTTTTTSSSTTITADQKVSRQLPIFNNPLIANAAYAKSNAPQPKSGRVKAGNTSTTKQVSVLKITAAKSEEGDVVVMRRMDSDLVHASAMYSAAYPSISKKMMVQENEVIAETFKASAVIVDKNCGNAALAGVWIDLEHALELAKEYGIDKFMGPLLDAPSTAARRKIIKSSSPVGSTVSDITASEETTEGSQEDKKEQEKEIKEETIEKVQEEEKKEEEKEESEESPESQKEITASNEETTATTEEEVVEEAQQEDEAETIAAVKRAREEDEEVSRSQKRFRGLVAVAVGVAAAAVIPQVLPYFQ
ncbi:hypothetical protein BG006_009454 [Podila minutissima]|uniref:HTH APSES-type domain-containing protein n=1 Tax=Podila minutissima TaxID=64525 RepID=A0A9P5VPN9_9FUNG|nr:hypothetical protein BG006_009454 [Podila minutissima]